MLDGDGLGLEGGGPMSVESGLDLTVAPKNQRIDDERVERKAFGERGPKSNHPHQSPLHSLKLFAGGVW